MDYFLLIQLKTSLAHFLILDFHIENKIYIFALNTLFIQNLRKRKSSENIDENISGEKAKKYWEQYLDI